MPRNRYTGLQIPRSKAHFCKLAGSKNGIDLYTVQRLLGHKTIAMTMRYSHLAVDNFKDAVSILDKKPTCDHKNDHSETNPSIG